MTAVVAIDLDLTLTNFLETFVQWYNNTKETKVKTKNKKNLFQIAFSSWLLLLL
jgi:5'(3')-deoxyribonucleotidase